VTVPAELGAAGAKPDGTMAISVFDLFKIGIGPSSSHTVGPMRAAAMFATSLVSEGLADGVAAIRVELFGSLGATGHGHGSVPAVVLGLLGEDPETVDPSATASIVDRVRQTGKLALGGSANSAVAREIDFDVDNDIVLHRRKRLPFHSNAMVFSAQDAGGGELSRRRYYSVGGGFVLGDDQAGSPRLMPDSVAVPYPFASGAELLKRTRASGLPISGVMLANELVRPAGGSGGSLPRASTAGVPGGRSPGLAGMRRRSGLACCEFGRSCRNALRRAARPTACCPAGSRYAGAPAICATSSSSRQM